MKYEGLLGCKGKPMTEDESRTFLTLMMMEMNIETGKTKPELLAQMDKDLEGCLGYQILKSRLALFKEKFSPTMQVEVLPQILCALMCDRPGNAVMWAYTLNEIFIKTRKPVTLKSVTDFFPWGFPTQEEYSKCWDAQKAENMPMGNMVDDFKNWSLPEEKKA